MSKDLTAPERLRLLLPWLSGRFDRHQFGGKNLESVGVHTDHAAIRHAIADFVASFDGSSEAAHIKAEPWDTLDDKAIDGLEHELNLLLRQGFGDFGTPTANDVTLPLTKLRFAVQSAKRETPKKELTKKGNYRVVGGKSALDEYRRPGAYQLFVEGPTRQLVPFLLAQLLTAPDMVILKRCERVGCSHLVTESRKRGGVQRFCSAACGAWTRELEKEQQPRRKR